MAAEGNQEEQSEPGADRREGRERHRGGAFLIPAGALIGLGGGMLAGQAGPGVLIGLGLGFVGSAVYSLWGGEDTLPGRRHGSVWIMGGVGVFLVLVGASIVLSPELPWITLIAVFLILLGLWFVARGIARRS